MEQKAARKIVLCVAGRCAGSTARAEEVWHYLQRRMEELGLNPAEAGCERIACLHVCANGPIAVVQPDGVWYHSVTCANAERILCEHFWGGQIVESLCFGRPKRLKMTTE